MRIHSVCAGPSSTIASASPATSAGAIPSSYRLGCGGVGNQNRVQTQSEASPGDVRPEGLPLQRDQSTASSLPLGIMKAGLTATFATSHRVA
jgi:hypothetical protein